MSKMKKRGKAVARVSQEEQMRGRGYLTVAEVAGKLGRCVGSIYRLLHMGRVDGLKVGYGHYVKRSSLVTYLGRDAARMIGFIESHEPEPVAPAEKPAK